MKKGLTGFTLIEMLIVIGIVTFIIPVMFSIIFSVLREQTKAYRLSVIKNEGDYLVNIISSTVRNYALTIHSASPPDESNQKCQIVETYTSPGSLYFLDGWGNWFGFYTSSNIVSSSSSELAAPLALHSQKTIISNFSIGCTRSVAYSPPSVSLSFDICFTTASGDCSSVRPEEIATLHYQTKIKLRNF